MCGLGVVCVDNPGTKRRETLCEQKVSMRPDRKSGADPGEFVPRRTGPNAHAQDWTESRRLYDVSAGGMCIAFARFSAGRMWTTRIRNQSNRCASNR